MKMESEKLIDLAKEVFDSKLSPDAFEQAQKILGDPIKQVFKAMEAEITDPSEMLVVQSLIILTQMWEACDRVDWALGKMFVHTSMKHTAQIMLGMSSLDAAKVERLLGLCEKYVKQLDSLAGPLAKQVREAAGAGKDYSKL